MKLDNLTIITVNDGSTIVAWVKEYPNVLVQGNTIEQIKEKLKTTFDVMFQHLINNATIIKEALHYE